jgi:tryptophan synthase beta chain
MATVPYKTYLTEQEMPRQWYNVKADMPEQHAPLLNPGTLKPVSAEDLYPVFARKCECQRISLPDDSELVYHQ